MMSDQFIDQTKEKIKLGIRRKGLDLDNIIKQIVSYDYDFLENFRLISHKFEHLNDVELITRRPAFL